MIGGSCLCGGVKWGFDGPAGAMSHCHCSMCRKAHGAPFATYLSVPTDAFRILAGAELIRRYESSPGFARDFCSRCGSTTPMPVPVDRVAIPAGGLDDDPGIRPTLHIFVASKAPWHRIADSLPQHDAYPAGGPAAIARAARGGGETLAGSCLCGAVAFEVTEPFVAIHNCHCARCRKARQAAHATNGIAPPGRFRFTRGAELVDQYKLPEAVSFTQAFCRVCGSGMPRVRADTGAAIVPMGALDDAPARGADDHIHVASKAFWYEIADDLPRFDAAPG